MTCKKMKYLTMLSLLTAGLSISSMGIRAKESLPEVQDLETAQEGQETHGIEAVQVPFYDYDEEPIGDIMLYFIDGKTELPYVEAKTIPALLAYAVGANEDLYSMEADDGVVEYTAWNDYPCMIDYNKNEIYFEDYNAFFMDPDASTILDMTFCDKDEDGNYRYVAPTEQNFERYGHQIELLLDNYCIELIHTDEYDLMPLQTMNDVFLKSYHCTILYNTEGAFWVSGGNLNETPMAKQYYNVSPGERSQDLADFNYLELCLVLDMYYGLKEVHNIEYFDKLFKDTGLFYPLTSTDPVEYTNALQELTEAYFGDLHSSFVAPSCYVGAELDNYEGVLSPTLIQDGFFGAYLSGVRSKYFPEEVPYYQEVGNTAYVTFDSFSYNDSIDYYNDGLPEDPSLWDTRGIIIYANSQIKREDSPVENIVIDLSLNGGGTVQSAVYVISWFLGSTNLNIEDTFTGAQVTSNYRADINLDGIYDSKDHVFGRNFNLYCLTSSYSFSCGNLVPCSFKNSGLVTLLGSSSGGGACSVLPISTADGSLFNISSNERISIVKNGSFYNVDQGTDVDFHIDKLDNYYDREALTEFINQLF